MKDVRVRRIPSQLGFVVEGAVARSGAVDWDSVGDFLSEHCESAILETGATTDEEEFRMAAEGWDWLRAWT